MSEIKKLFFINTITNRYTNFYDLFSELKDEVNNEEHIYISFYLLFKNYMDSVFQFDNDKIKIYMKYLSILFLLNLIKIVDNLNDELVYNIILLLKKEKDNEKIKDIYNKLISDNETDEKKKNIIDNKVIKTKFENIINGQNPDKKSIFSNIVNQKQFKDYTDKLYLFTIQYIFNEIFLLKEDDIINLFKDFNTFYNDEVFMA
jgi:hypothetical protein